MAVGVWGTFDVDNYGDQLFPRITALELRRRLPGVALRFASPYGNRWHPTRLDGDVAVEALPPWSRVAAADARAAHHLTVVGGGELMHLNDRMLGAVYGRNADELAALAPSRWFAGAEAWHCVGVPEERAPGADELLRTGAAGAAYVSVRDEASAARLCSLGVERDIAVVPDPAFLLDRVLGGSGGSPVGGYVAVQGCDLLVPFAGALAEVLCRVEADVLLVETGRARGDAVFADSFARACPRPVRRMSARATVADIDAAIGGAHAFVGSSLHGCITSFVRGRPFVVLNMAGEAKLDALGATVGRTASVVHRVEDVLAALAAPVTEGVPLVDLQRRIDEHFDRLADLVRERTAAGPVRRDRWEARTRSHPAAVRASAATVGFVELTGAIRRQRMPAALWRRVSRQP